MLRLRLYCPILTVFVALVTPSVVCAQIQTTRDKLKTDDIQRLLQGYLKKPHPAQPHFNELEDLKNKFGLKDSKFKYDGKQLTWKSGSVKKMPANVEKVEMQLKEILVWMLFNVQTEDKDKKAYQSLLSMTDAKEIVGSMRLEWDIARNGHESKKEWLEAIEKDLIAIQVRLNKLEAELKGKSMPGGKAQPASYYWVLTYEPVAVGWTCYGPVWSYRATWHYVPAMRQP
jgi:hypothetical protein